MSEQNDCEEQGFSRIEDGCFACAPTFVDGKAVYPRIEPRGPWLCCVKCGGSHGPTQPCKRCHGEGCTNEGDPEIGNAYFECEACGGTGSAAGGIQLSGQDGVTDNGASNGN